MTDLQPTKLQKRDLEGLYALASELLQLDDYDRMLDAVMRHSLSVLRAERGFVVLTHDDGLDFKVVRNWSRDELEGSGEPISRSIVIRVLEQGEPVLVEDALSDKRFAKMESVLRMGIRSVLAAPLDVDGQRVGALYLEASSLDRLFGPAQLALFRSILDLSSKALESCLKRLVLEQRNTTLEKDFFARYDFSGIITHNAGFLQALEKVALAASSDLPVLVLGESGTGKELIVRALHRNSPRRNHPLVVVNCGAISPSLLESELFGHKRGAFTGANRDKQGLIASAHGGSVFLDEVGELPPELQVKLLRTLQFGEIQPVGAVRPQTVDVRFLAATNRDLLKAVTQGDFREDLFYRLNVVTIELPPLRTRRDDILPLFRHFLEEAATKTGRQTPEISSGLEGVLVQHDWPGNVRQLRNEAQGLFAMTPPGLPLTADRLSPAVVGPGTPKASGPASLDDHKRRHVEEALQKVGGNRTQAAKALGISREGLRKMMKRFRLT